MPNGKVYDPLVGQWMTPMWEGLLSNVYQPKRLHLYRFNGNDPVNVREKDFFLKGTRRNSIGFAASDNLNDPSFFSAPPQTKTLGYRNWATISLV